MGIAALQANSVIESLSSPPPIDQTSTSGLIGAKPQKYSLDSIATSLSDIPSLATSQPQSTLRSAASVAHLSTAQNTSHHKGMSPLRAMLQIASVLGSAQSAEALCWCKDYLTKTYGDEYSTNSKQVPINIGCNDLDLKTECEETKFELVDFVNSVMRGADIAYFTPMQQANILSDTATDTKSTQQLKLSHERTVLANAVEDRAKPDCASGLHTTTPLSLKPALLEDPNNRKILSQWSWPVLEGEGSWDINQLQGEGFCYSNEILDSIQKALDDNTANLGLKVPGFSRPPDSQGLTPYTLRIMDHLVKANISSVLQDIIWDRIQTEPPDIRIPSTEFHSMVKEVIPSTPSNAIKTNFGVLLAAVALGAMV